MAASMSRKELLSKVYKMIPPMLDKFHKGEDETINPALDMSPDHIS